MVAPGQHRRARRRTQCSRMKLVVQQAFLRELLRGRHAHEATCYARPAKADVIEQYEENVGRAFGGFLRWREVGFRLRRIGSDLCIRKPPLGFRKMSAIEMKRKARV